MTLTERMPVVSDEHIDTSDEAWAPCEAWYGVAADYAVAKLGAGEGRKCLVIGSPEGEVTRLGAAGWRTLFADVRPAPEYFGLSFEMDATDMAMLPANQFDAVSSTCVLCHAGLGRYGDPVKPNGDVLMMGEIARVLKPGGSAVLMAGPALPDELLPRSVVHGNVHRIYRPADVVELAAAVGLECVDMLLCGPRSEPAQKHPDGSVDYCYLSLWLRKGAA